MLKIILILLIVSQINCDEDKQTFSDDEIDITNVSAKGAKNSVENKQKPGFGSGEKGIPKSKVEEDISKEDKAGEEDVPEVNFGKDGEKRIDGKEKTGFNNEKHNKNVFKDEEKTAVNEKDIGTDEKNVFNNENPDKDIIKDDDKKVIVSTEEDLGIDKQNKDKPINKNEVNNGNEIMDSLLNIMKKDYSKEFDKVSISDFGPLKHGRWGSITLHGGIVTGLSNLHRHGDVIIKISEQNKKLFIGDIAINDVKIDFKVNAKLFHRIPINNRELHLWIKQALLNVILELDLADKKLVITQISVKSLEGFGFRSGRLFWPFNKLTDAILKNEELAIKSLIKQEISKYIGKVVHDIKFEEVFAKFF